MRLKVPGPREEEAASKVETVFVIQVHIPLVAARDTLSLTEVS